MGLRRLAMSAVAAASLIGMLVASPGGLIPAGAASASTGRIDSTPGHRTAHSAAVPTVAGPIPGTPVLAGTSFDLSQVGYEQSEYFLSGTATSYTSSAPLTSDGKWRVTPSTTAPYTTRVVVYRPSNPHKFNGTVIVEWLNVSGGLDDAPDWVLAHTELIREGYAWVGVSAQAVGVNQLKCPATPPLPATCVAPGNPARYGSLSHPGDSYSYDIFSQAGQAIRHDSAQVLEGLKPQHVIAVGESQSAFRLVTYIDGVQPLVHEYDGFLVLSEFGTGAPLSQSPQASVVPPTPTHLRNDLRTPVFLVETETDVSNSALFDRQPNTRDFRLWEIAGTAHFDYYGLEIGPTDTGNGQGAVLNLAAMQNPTNNNPPPGFECALSVNTGATQWNLNAAVFWLNRWVAHGTPPPKAPLLRTKSAPGVSPVVFAKDANGNVLGGVRSPLVDAPIAALSGIGNGPGPTPSPLSVSCALFGSTVPFTSSQLAGLYNSHRQFVFDWARATLKDVRQGYLLPADAVQLIQSAAASQIGN